MTITRIPATMLNITIATRTALAALPLGGLVFLTEGGRRGPFLWMSGDYSAKVSADPQQGIYVPSSLVPATAGCWVRQYVGDLHAVWFGVKGDWDHATGDAAATDDKVALQAALTYAGQIWSDGGDLGGGNGMRVWLPGRQTCMLGGPGPLVVPKGVRLLGHGVFSSVLKMKDTFPAGQHFIVLGDAAAHLSDFGCALEDLQIFNNVDSGNLNDAMVYSNSAQHTAGVNRVKIYAGARIGLWLENGYGGASTITMDDVEVFNKYNLKSNPGVILNYAGALTMVGRRWVIQGPSAANASSVGTEIRGGLVILDGYHTEGIETGILVNIRVSNDQGIALLRGVTAAPGMLTAIRVDSAAAAGVLNATGVMTNGASHAIVNQRSGGSNTDGNVYSTVTI